MPKINKILWKIAYSPLEIGQEDALSIGVLQYWNNARKFSKKARQAPKITPLAGSFSTSATLGQIMQQNHCDIFTEI